MGYVHGHWRETGWVRGHFRHPLRPGLDQVELVLLVDSPVRIDPSRYGAADSCPMADRPTITVPEPRSPATTVESAVPGPGTTSGRAGAHA